METARRAFLKTGLAGAVLLATGGAIYRLTRAPAQPDPFTLDGDAAAVLAALMPVMLGPVLPDDATVRATALRAGMDRVIGAIHTLPLATQKEVQDLFGLLALGPVRRLLAGVSGGWPQADAQQVADFLQSWRMHRLTTPRIAYLALHDLITGAWYADPSTWAAIGYPGPIKELT